MIKKTFTISILKQIIAIAFGLAIISCSPDSEDKSEKNEAVKTEKPENSENSEKSEKPAEAKTETTSESGDADFWSTDFAAAQAQATSEKKTLLVNFSGSDWCGWCQRLDAEVFSKADFQSEALKKYVPVVLDFPRGSQLPEAQSAQNDALAEKYEIEGFPTILLLAADGTELARTGYQEGGSKNYLTHLAEVVEETKGRFSALEEAAKLSGIERATAYMQIFSKMNEVEVIEKFSEEIKTSIAGDPEDKSGIALKYGIIIKMRELGDKLDAASQAEDYDGFIGAIDDFLAKNPNLPDLEKQSAMFAKIGAFMEKNETDKVKTLLQDIVKINPDNEAGTEAKNALDKFDEIFMQTESDSQDILGEDADADDYEGHDHGDEDDQDHSGHDH